MPERPNYHSYYLDIEKLAQAILQREDPEYLLQVDFEEYLQHLVGQLSREPLEWDEAKMTVEPFIARRLIKGFGQGIMVEQPRLRLRIPVRHSNLEDYLHYQPSIQLIRGEPEWNFQESFLVMEIDANDMSVEKALEEVHFWFGGRNREIDEGNQHILDRSRAVWSRTREELRAHAGELSRLVERLKIPLHQNPGAPKPVTLHSRTARKSRPIIASVDPELNREDVCGVVRFVESYSKQFEVSPKVYSERLDEEDLRDLVLAMLNVNYPGSTGESFSKFGKTDMFLHVGEGGSLIVECKKWRGQKNYVKSLEQLFGYLTWRHSYGILLTFCTSHNMTTSINLAQSGVRAHQTSRALEQLSTTLFASQHAHPQDIEKTVEIFHIFVDLSS